MSNSGEDTPERSNSTESEESSQESEDFETDKERAIREAADLHCSQPLRDAYISNDDKHLKPMRLFVDPSLKSLDVENYAYCLVDSNSYRLSEKEDFRAFIKSVRYIGKGTFDRCCKHPWEKGPEGFDKKPEIKKMWKRGGKLTAVCLISSSEENSMDMEAHMLEAFAQYYEEGNTEYYALWNLNKGTYKGGKIEKVLVQQQQYWGVQLLYTAWKVYVDKPVIANMILSYSEAVREETAEQKILKEATAFGYSETLTGAFKSNSMFVNHLEKAFPMKNFYSPTNVSGDVKFYAYCLVDSTSYKSSGKEDFQAFIRSVRYIGRGTGWQCFTLPLNPDNSENIWKEGGKWTAVCLGYFSSKIADDIKALLMAAIGKMHLSQSEFPDRQLLNCDPVYYRGKKKLSRKEQESWGVQLLYTAWKVYEDKPVILEMMLSRPKIYAEEMTQRRAKDKRRRLQTAAQEYFSAANECFTAAQYQAAFDHKELMEKRYNEASKTFEEKKKSLKEADDKIKDMEIVASKRQLKTKRKKKQKLQADMDAAKLKQAAESALKAAKSKKETAKRDVESARLHMNATEDIKKKAETDIEKAEKVMAALRIQPDSD